MEQPPLLVKYRVIHPFLRLTPFPREATSNFSTRFSTDSGLQASRQLHTTGKLPRKLECSLRGYSGPVHGGTSIQARSNSACELYSRNVVGYWRRIAWYTCCRSKCGGLMTTLTYTLRGLERNKKKQKKEIEKQIREAVCVGKPTYGRCQVGVGSLPAHRFVVRC